MTYTKENLYDFWTLFRHRPAWLSIMRDRLQLNDEGETYLNDLEDRFNETTKAMKQEWKTGWPLVLDTISDWRGELGEWAKDRRKEYLEQNIQNLGHEIDGIYRDYAEAAAQDRSERTLVLKCSGVHDLEKRRDRFSWELKALTGQAKSDGLESYQIEKARIFPLEKLIEPGKGGMILCPLHEDQHPSMLVKNGFGYCFSCGGHLDSIGYMMKVRGLTFRQAVEALQ